MRADRKERLESVPLMLLDSGQGIAPRRGHVCEGSVGVSLCFTVTRTRDISKGLARRSKTTRWSVMMNEFSRNRLKIPHNYKIVKKYSELMLV